MNEIELFQRFGLAIAIGALVGIERHWREKDEPAGDRTAGLRTFTLIGMLGGAAGLIERALAPTGSIGGVALVGLFLGLAGAVTWFMMREAEAEESFSVTSVVAAMATYALGAIAVLGEMRVAAAGGVAVTGILASREVSHDFMRTLKWAELRSAIVLLAMTFVVLPLIPHDPIGPFGGVSPAKIWILAIVLAAISFTGYVAVKVVGHGHGELLAGAIGGLASSTATTIANARHSKEEEGSAGPLTAGALAAGAVSYVRTAVLVIATAPSLALGVGPALGVGAVILTGGALIASRAEGKDGAASESRNPFSLRWVLQMAALLGFVLFVAQASAAWFGAGGVFVVAALSGLADVDAASLTMANMAGGALAVEAAALGVMIAVASNTIAKAGYAIALGSSRFGWTFAAASALTLVGAGVVFFGMRWLS